MAIIAQGHRDFQTDATRPRRYRDAARQKWYTRHRAERWRRRYFG